jgi:hypothetical protein
MSGINCRISQRAISTQKLLKNDVSYLYCQAHPDIVTMKHQYISTQSNELLSYFNKQNRHCFDYSLAYKALPDSKASAVDVRDQQIEKGYILSCILFGIAKHEQISKTTVFIGGTVLKKVYF